MGELGLGEEDCAERDTVATADKFAFGVPHFEGMHVARVENAGIGMRDARRVTWNRPSLFPAQALITPSKSWSKVTV